MTSLMITPLAGVASDYRGKGFARISGLFSREEVAALQAEANRLALAPGLLGDAARGAVRTNGPRLDRLDPVIDASPAYAALATDIRLLDLAATLLGGPCQLMKDKFIRKPPGTVGYSVHQDAAYWHELCIAGDRIVSLAVLIDRCAAASGPLEFAPGHHLDLLTPPGVVADPDPGMFERFETVTGEAGDIVAFSALAPHRSGPNLSDGNRTILFLTYARDERPDLYGCYQQVRQGF